MENIDQAVAGEGSVAGSVIDANITDDVIRVKITSSPESAEIGVPYMIEGDKYLFFCMSTNIFHESKPIVKEIANTRIFDAPIQHTREDAGALQPVQFPAILELACLKVIARDGHEAKGFKTIPSLFSKVHVATPADIQIMSEDLAGNEHVIGNIGKFVGTVCDAPVDLSALFEVPFGIFGRTRKGKTVTAKSLIIMALARECTVNGRPVQFIVFDPQNEYSVGAGRSGSTGLLHCVPSKIYQLSVDFNPGTPSTSPLYINPAKLTVDDWINAMWDCTPNMVAITREFEKARNENRATRGDTENNADLGAYLKYIYDNTDAFDAIKGDRPERYPMGTVNAIWRRMLPFNSDKFRRSFLQKPPEGYYHVTQSVSALLRAGKSIIISFGKFQTDKDVYTFVANYITRNIYWNYSQSEGDESLSWLPHLVLLVEEAHKFVPKSADVGVGGESFFSNIAREMGKFGLTVGLIDQRPSKMDDEVTSQIGSRVIHRLDDPDDVKAALAGLNKAKWSPIIGKLGKGEGLFFGDIVGDVPTMIKPFFSRNIREVKEYYGCSADVPLSAFMANFPAVTDEDDVSDPNTTSAPPQAPPAPVSRVEEPDAGSFTTADAKKPAGRSKKPAARPEKKPDGKPPAKPAIQKTRSIDLGDTSDTT